MNTNISDGTNKIVKKKKSKPKKRKAINKKDKRESQTISDDIDSDIDICEFSDGEEMDDVELRNDVDKFINGLHFERFSGSFQYSSDENDYDDASQSPKKKKVKNKVQKESKYQNQISDIVGSSAEDESNDNCKTVSENKHENELKNSKRIKKNKKKIKKNLKEHIGSDSEPKNTSKSVCNNKEQRLSNKMKKDDIKNTKELSKQLKSKSDCCNNQGSLSNLENTNEKYIIKESDPGKSGTSPKVNVEQKKNEIMDKLKKQLQSASFRLINERLYTSSGTDAYQLFEGDPNSFKVYHEGYSKQVSEWPVNPLDLIISWLRKKPRNWTIADFGCGKAILSKSVKQKVYSLDLIASRPNVIKCNMAHTPLESASVDVAVFCLSLMGTNLTEFIVEANRVLVDRGVLKIAEIESRFENNVNHFLKVMSLLGFKNIHKNQNQNYFWLFDFVKIKNVKLKSKLPELKLKPCMYKKR